MHEFGPPSVLRLQEVPDPQPSPEQVVVEVEFANITFVETQIRAGKAPNPAMLPRLPAILGNGVGGTVAGRRVVASLHGTGGYAERAAADVDALIEVPPELSTQHAVALLADGRTALALLRASDLKRGETVLVEAAAGGVGSLLVQLAASAGAHVIAAAAGQHKIAVALELGAHQAVDYGDASWSDALTGAVDVVFDGVGGRIGRAAFDTVRRGGRYFSFGMASGTFADIDAPLATARGVQLVRGTRLSPYELRELARTALHEAAVGRLRPVVGQTFPLPAAAEAHAAIEARATIGKTLLGR